MNIILKSFDGPENHIAIEHALKDMDLGTVISLLWAKQETPTLRAKEHLVWDARKFRWADYSDVDWTDITPLDEEIIEGMRECEGRYMAMITRNSLYEIPYSVRKKTYYENLRYWNHILETKQIDLMLLNHAPHQCYDLVIYHLCKLKKIPTIIVLRIDCLGVQVLIESYEDCATQVRDIYHRLRKNQRDASAPVELPPRMEKYYEGQTMRDEAPWSMYPRPSYLMEKNFVKKWSGIAARMLKRKPLTFLRYVLSPRFWKRKIREHRTIRFYDDHAKAPDFSVPYVYVPLHMQPEATTSPLGGAFVDQELMVQLLARHLPPGIRLYVKEHPHQRELWRSIAFYESLLALPSVTLVPRMTSTVQLAEHAEAIATVTGTAGFEALFRERPVFLFGHIYYQYAEGVYRIRSADDCRKATEEVFAQKKRPTLRDIRLYLKAIGECSSIYDCAPLLPGESITVAEQNAVWGDFMAREIPTMLSASGR